MKHFSLFAFVLAAMFAEQALALNIGRYAFMAQIVDCNDVGVKLPADQSSLQSFQAQMGEFQDALIRELKSQGALQQVLEVHNTFSAKQLRTVYVLLSEEGDAMGIVVESAGYSNKDVYNNPRFDSISYLNRGVSLAYALDKEVVGIKGNGLQQKSGGSFKLSFSKSIRSGEMDALDLLLRKNAGGAWEVALASDPGQVVKKATAEIDFSLWRMDGGVKRIQIN